MTYRRREPYTQIGIRRVTCAVQGCARKSIYQWQCCADRNTWRGVCAEHDIELNTMVTRFFFGDTREADIAAYAERVRTIHGNHGDHGNGMERDC